MKAAQLGKILNSLLYSDFPFGSFKTLIDLNEPFSRANQDSLNSGRIDLASLWSQEDEQEPGRSTGQNVYETFETTEYSKPKLI